MVMNNSSRRTSQVESLDEEIKTALQVKIFGREKSDNTTFYVIRTWLVYQPGEISDALRKRYNNFCDLNENLESLGYQFLPLLPKKKYLMSERDLEERQRMLEQYLKQIINRKDTRNSMPVIEFLRIHQFYPEIMFNVPQLLIKKQFPRGRFYVNHCLFLEQHNLYVISITDRSNKTSSFEIYSFRQTGLIQDQYKLKNTEPIPGSLTQSGSSTRMSVAEVLQSPMNKGHRNTLFSSIPETKDASASANIRLQNLKEQQKQPMKLEKLLATEEHPYKIQCMTYCQSADMLSVGFSNGQIVNYTLEIESYVLNNDTDTSVSPNGSNGNNLIQKKSLDKKKQRQLYYNEGSILARVNYIQSDDDTPELDVDQGCFNEVQEEHKGATEQQPNQKSRGSWLKKFKLLTHSCTQIHSCVKAMIVDQQRCLLYSTGKDRVIHCQNLNEKVTAGFIKTSNARPVDLEIDEDLERLYVSTREGIVLIFDIKNPKSPVMVHMMRICKPSRANPNDFVKQMDLDRDRNILICRAKSGIISVVQLMNRGLVKSTVIEVINSYNGTKDDSLSSFKWLSRMSCYVEGTQKGYLRIRDIEKGGECLLMLHTNFQEKVRLVHYNNRKNVLFSASKDGGFRVWKIPHEWRSKVIEEREMNAEYERRKEQRKIRGSLVPQQQSHVR